MKQIPFAMILLFGLMVCACSVVPEETAQKTINRWVKIYGHEVCDSLSLSLIKLDSAFYTFKQENLLNSIKKVIDETSEIVSKDSTIQILNIHYHGIHLKNRNAALTQILNLNIYECGKRLNKNRNVLKENIDTYHYIVNNSSFSGYKAYCVVNCAQENNTELDSIIFYLDKTLIKISGLKRIKKPLNSEI